MSFVNKGTRCLFIFATVKYNKYISYLSILLLSMVFLGGSTGITVILHECPKCGDFSVNSGIYLATSEPEDHCCEHADNHSNLYSHSSESYTGAGCHFKIDRLILETYTTADPVNFFPVIALPFFISNKDITSFTKEAPTFHLTFHNKHGGRHLITFNCQLLA